MIKSRQSQLDPTHLAEAQRVVAEEVRAEFDLLVDRIDSFLELRIAAEFDELRDDLESLAAENALLRDQVTALAIENINLHIQASKP